MRLKQAALLLPLVLLAAPALRAEYIVLRSGQRLVVTGYQLLGDKYRLQMGKGWVEIPVQEVVTIEPEEVFVPVPAQPEAKPLSPYRELVEAAAARYNVDADLITSVIEVESKFDPKAVSPKDARGLMQLLPETAARLGVKNILDPQENIDAGTRYLKELLQKYKNDLALALAAYNAGPDKVQQRVPPIAETISYVRRVKSSYEKSKGSTPEKKSTQTGAAAVASPTPSSSLPRAREAQ